MKNTTFSDAGIFSKMKSFLPELRIVIKFFKDRQYSLSPHVIKLQTSDTMFHIKSGYLNDNLEFIVDPNKVLSEFHNQDKYTNISDFCEMIFKLCYREYFIIVMHYTNKEHADKKYKVWNIARDVDLNQFLHLDKLPSIEEYQLAPNLGAETYYELLLNIIDDDEETENHPMINNELDTPDIPLPDDENDSGKGNSSNEKDDSNEEFNTSGNNSEENGDSEDDLDEESDNESTGNSDEESNEESEENQENDSDNNEEESDKESENSEGNESNNDSDKNDESDDSDESNSDNQDENEDKDDDFNKNDYDNLDYEEDEFDYESDTTSEEKIDKFLAWFDSIMEGFNSEGEKFAGFYSSSPLRKPNFNKYKKTQLFEVIYNRIYKKVNVTTIVKTTKKDSYFKYSSKTDYLGNNKIIFPGKAKVSGGFSYVVQKTPIIFIDMSYSTIDINPILNNLAYNFHKNNYVVCFYDTRILDLIKPGETFRACASCGGTDSGSSVEQFIEYIRENGDPKYSIDNCYIITDGYESFNSMFELIPNTTIFKIVDKNSVLILEGKDEQWKELM